MSDREMINKARGLTGYMYAEALLPKLASALERALDRLDKAEEICEHVYCADFPWRRFDELREKMHAWRALKESK